VIKSAKREVKQYIFIPDSGNPDCNTKVNSDKRLVGKIIVIIIIIIIIVIIIIVIIFIIIIIIVIIMMIK